MSVEAIYQFFKNQGINGYYMLCEATIADAAQLAYFIFKCLFKQWIVYRKSYAITLYFKSFAFYQFY